MGTSKKLPLQVRQIEKSESEKRAVSALRHAEARRKLDDKLTVGLYAVRGREAPLYSIPFVAKSDTLAALAFRSCLEMEHEDSSLVGSDLYQIGWYRLDTAQVKACRPRFISY